MRTALAFGAAAAALLAAAPEASARLALRECGAGEFRCGRLAVPLDRAGALKGRVTLRIRVARARAKRRGTVVLLAGGPGQSAISAFVEGAFDLGPLEPLARHNDILVFDQRGSGGSGLLRCRELERANILRAAGPAARCAAKLGARRAFYTSRDTADDLEAIRRALGAGRLSLYGVSYGTRTAAAYAIRYPRRVQRLVLDSVVAPDGADALGVDTFRAAPRVLRSLCAGRRCDSFTADPVADVAGLVRRIAATGPLRGRIVDSRGRSRRAALSRYDVLSSLVSGDFEPALRTAYPAAVKAALGGDPAPLLRLKRRSIAVESDGFEPDELSTALYAATTCEEAKLPWPRGTPFAQRARFAATAAGGLAATVLGPFDTATVLGSDTLDLCSRWPESARDVKPGPGPIPDVPALLVEGADDLRTPLETAQAVAAGLPRARVVTVAGVGHSPGSGGLSRCGERLAAAFFTGRRVPRACRDYRSDAPAGVPPRSLKGLTPVAAFERTIDDVLEDTIFSAGRGAGLRAGRYSLDRDLRLRGLSYVPGLKLTGRIARFDSNRGRRGTIRLSGPRAYRGTLRFRGTRVTGRLGGRRVGGRLALGATSGTHASGAHRRQPRPALVGASAHHARADGLP